MKATQRLHGMGQGLWLDNITRGLSTSGPLRRYIGELSVTGLTSNPPTFDHAIENSRDYDDAVRRKLEAGHSGETLCFEPAVEDLRQAADPFRPNHEQTNGVDGWVSLEVSPALANDTAGSIAAVAEIQARAARPNLCIEIPGTRARLPAIEEAIFAGVPVNATLLFSREQYVAAADAYSRGIERRIAAGPKPDVFSVASVLVSRWDVAVMGNTPEAPRGRLGIAPAFTPSAAPPPARIPRRGCGYAFGSASSSCPHPTPMRAPLARRVSKTPRAFDLLDVAALAAPFRINTMPEVTSKALADHGESTPAMPPDGGDGGEVLAEFAKAGIDLSALVARLQDEGAASFVESWNDRMRCIASKSEECSHG